MKALIGLIVIIVFIGGGVWYFSLGGPGGNPTDNSAMMEGDSIMEDGNQNTMGSGTFMDLMRLGGSFECTIKDPISRTNGKVYMSNGKVRGEFMNMMDEQPYDSHFINADGYIYTWSSVTPQGFKMKAPEAEGTTMDGEKPDGSVDMNQRVDYSCAPWVANTSMFIPPQGIEFMDFTTGVMPGSGMMPQGVPDAPPQAY